VCWIAPKARPLKGPQGFLQLAQSGYAEFLVDNLRHAQIPLSEIVTDYLAMHPV
jgi:hypothetical protein